MSPAKKAFDQNAVLALLARAAAPSLKVGEIADALKVSQQDRARLRRLLSSLADQELLHKVGRGAYALPAPAAPEPVPEPVPRVAPVMVPAPEPAVIPTLPVPAAAVDPERTGRITVHPAGYGFVEVEDGSDAIFVPAKYRGSALDGDRVVLTLWQGYKGREGRVVEVLSRGRAKLTGTLRRARRTLYLEPDDPRIATAYGHVPLIEGLAQGKVGEAAVVEICHYPTSDRPELVGRLLRVLGQPDDPRTEIEKMRSGRAPCPRR
jgi:exoribonuclease R